MSPTDYTSIAVTALNQLPGILALIRANHAQANPGAPPLTDAEVIKGLQDAVASSVATDEEWKAQHPVSTDKPNGDGITEE